VWTEVRDVVMRAWAWLDAHHPDAPAPGSGG
jgi:hypothetical protein